MTETRKTYQPWTCPYELLITDYVFAAKKSRTIGADGPGWARKADNLLVVLITRLTKELHP